jgi:hypothetical protein
VVVVDSEVPESGWIPVDLARRIPTGPAAPGAGWDGAREPCWRGEAVSRCRSGPSQGDGGKSFAKEPLTIARLEAWAERLRGAEKPKRTDDGAAPVVAEDLGAEPPPIAVEPAPVAARRPVEKAPVRGIRPEDLVPVGKKRFAPAVPDPSAVPEPPLVRPRLRIVAGRSRFGLAAVPSSPGVRFVLLCLAAFFLSAGVVHSFARWKQTRVIVVPVPSGPGSVIT